MTGVFGRKVKGKKINKKSHTFEESKKVKKINKNHIQERLSFVRAEFWRRDDPINFAPSSPILLLQRLSFVRVEFWRREDPIPFAPSSLILLS
jgi:hypothetical protein